MTQQAHEERIHQNVKCELDQLTQCESFCNIQSIMANPELARTVYCHMASSINKMVVVTFYCPP